MLSKLRSIVTRKCVICGRRRKINIFITEVWGGEKINYTYHYSCVRECLANPEKYSNEQLDKAIRITKGYAEGKKKAKELERQRKAEKESLCIEAKEEYKKIYSLEEDRNSDFLPDSKEN